MCENSNGDNKLCAVNGNGMVITHLFIKLDLPTKVTKSKLSHDYTNFRFIRIYDILNLKLEADSFKC